jgi:hypothetical protein
MYNFIEFVFFGLLIYASARVAMYVVFLLAEAYRLTVNKMELEQEENIKRITNQIKNTIIPVDIQLVDTQLMAYHKETSAFLGQAPTMFELFKRLEELHPAKYISVQQEDLNKLDIDIDRVIQQTINEQ